MASTDMQQGSHQTYNKNLIDQLLRVAQSKTSGCLRIKSGSIRWQLHFQNGALIYGSDSVSAWDRLERLLRFVGCQPLPHVSDAHAKVPHAFVDNLDQVSSVACVDSAQQSINWLLQQQYIDSSQAADVLKSWMQPDRRWSEDPTYQCIYWLASQEVLNPEQTRNLVELILREVLEFLLIAPIDESEVQLQDRLAGLPRYGQYEVETTLNKCLQRLQRWQKLAPSVWSPYQRPYFFGQSEKAKQLSPELKQRLGSMLRGFSFCHLAAALRKDEYQLAQSLQPYIQQGIVFLREPQDPFDLLPRIPSPEHVAFPASVTEATSPIPSSLSRADSENGFNESGDKSSFPDANDRYKIACVDDSLAMLNEITRLLGDEQFSVTAINNPVRALMQIVRVQPNLVLLDVGMPGMDGYELCRLLRNHPLFEKTPVIMVTGHTGIIDRARAKLVGATDYLTKPFTKEGLLKMVTKHLAIAIS